MFNKQYFKKIVIPAVGFIILIVSFWIYFSQSSRFADALEVKRTDISENISVVGKIIAAEKVDIGFEEAGVLSSIEISKGSKVKTGDILARLDKSGLEIE